MSFLFGSAPSVSTTTQPTINPTQENILNILAGYLQSGATAPGATPGAPTSIGELAPQASPLQNLSLAGLSNIGTNIIPQLLSQFNPISSANAATTAEGGALNFQGPGAITAPTVSPGQVPLPSPVTAPQITAPQVTAPTVATPANVNAPQVTTPNINANQVIQQSVIDPLQQQFTDVVLPAIEGHYGQSAGGGFSSDALEARTQAAQNLETTEAAEAGSLGFQAASSNQGATLATNQLNVGSALQAALANQNVGLTSALTNANLLSTAGLANQNASLTAQGQNQQAGVQTGEFNAQLPAQVGEFNVGTNLTGQTTNAGNLLSTAGLNSSNQFATQNAILSALGLSPAISGLPYGNVSNLGNIWGGLLAGGAVPYNIQSAIDTATNTYAQLPFNQTNQRLGYAISAAGFPSQQTTSVVNPGSSGLIPGLLGGLGSNPSSLTSGGNVLTTGGSGLLGLLSGGIFGSDEELKEDIEEVGELDNDVKLFLFRYKGEPQRRLGFVAQDVEKKVPDAVYYRLSDGMKAVDYGRVVLDALAA